MFWVKCCCWNVPCALPAGCSGRVLPQPGSIDGAPSLTLIALINYVIFNVHFYLYVKCPLVSAQKGWVCWQGGAEGQDPVEQWVPCCLQDAHSVAQWTWGTAGHVGFSAIQCVFNEFYNRVQGASSLE